MTPGPAMHQHRQFASSTRVPRVLSLVLALGACTESPAEVSPTFEPSTRSAALRSAAFLLDVNTVQRTVQVSPPTAGVLPGALSAGHLVGQLGAGVHGSLLGADVIEMRITNYTASAIGAVVPGKILLAFDLTLVNRLRSVELGTPTFPTPPAGAVGVQAFPYEISVFTSPGGVSSRGNEVLVSSPSFGAAIASDDWDGAPHSFFNDAACTPTSNDCFRYEPFGSIGANAPSEARRVGFLVDPTVRDLRIRLLVAADVRPASIATDAP
jgi:hypothetical protein